MGAFGLNLPVVGMGEIPTFGAFGTPPTISAVPQIQTPEIDTSSIGDIISSGIATGLDAWKTQLQYDLLNAQINKGQTPSIVAGPNGAPSAGLTSTTVYGPDGKPLSTTYSAGSGAAATGSLASVFGSSGLIWIIVVVFLLMLLKR